MVFLFLLLFFVLFDLCSLVTELFKALDDGLRLCLVSVVGDGDALLGNVTLNLLL